MSKAFEYKEVKELIKYYKNLFNEKKNNNFINNQYKNSLLLKISILNKNNLFSKLINDSLNAGVIDLENDDIKELISNIYYYKISDECYYSCNSFYNDYYNSINEKLNLLSKGTNPISWLFTSKYKKDYVERIYVQLNI